MQGDSNPKHPPTLHQLTPEAHQALQVLESVINSLKLNRVDYAQPWALIILATTYSSTGCLWQEGPFEWLHLSATPKGIVISFPALVALLVMKGS